MTKKIIDSHLHVWANEQEAASAFPYSQGQDPPPHLRDRASIAVLLESMQTSGVDGALIVQPINHKFDHSYVLSALQQHPGVFKGMLLHDPSESDPIQAVASLEKLALQGFCGVRFNPYLWPKDDAGGTSSMCTPAGLAVYRRCGELRMPVGIMCFQGLDLHYQDILQLLETSPTTPMILDHFAFTKLSEGDGESKTFQQLLSLAQYPSVHVKISALFRLDDEDTETYRGVYNERFRPLLTAYGPDRLLYGSDFPFCLEQPAGYTMHKIVAEWCRKHDKNTEAAIMGGTAERLWGPWGAQ